MDNEESKKEFHKIKCEQRGKAILKGTQEQFHQDGYMNMLNKWGTAQDNSEAYKFQAEEIVDDMELIKLYEGNGLFTKIINRPSEEAIKHGFDIDYGDENIAEYVEHKLDELNFEEKFVTAEKWARLFGGSIIVMLVDDGRGLEESLDWNNIRSIDELRVFERSIVQPDYTSLYSFDFEDTINRPFGQPLYYDVFSLYGHFRVHYTRCLIFKNGTLPEHTSNAIFRHWGIPEYVKIKRALRETVTSHSDGVKLLERSVQAIYKMKNLANMLATDEGENAVIRRMQVIDMARGILNSLAIDAEGEEYDFKNLQMSGIKDIIDSTCNMLSAVTDIPQTILFGRSPAGENSTGKSDLENYYNMIESIQKMNMKANSRKVIDLILLEGKRKCHIDKILQYKVKFAKLWSLSEKEQAEVEQSKAATELSKAQTAQIYIDIQALDPSEVRAGLAKGNIYEIQDLVPEDVFDIPDGEMDIEGITESDAEATDSDIEIEAAAVIVTQDGKFLVGERVSDGMICGPGGHIETGETPKEAAKREALEEFSIHTHNLIPLGVVEASSKAYCDSMVYLCTDFTGTPKADGEEMINARFADISELNDGVTFVPFFLSLVKLCEKVLHNE